MADGVARAAAAKLFAKPFDFMAKKSPFRSNYMFSQDYIDELTVRAAAPGAQRRRAGLAKRGEGDV